MSRKALTRLSQGRRADRASRLRSSLFSTGGERSREDAPTRGVCRARHRRLQGLIDGAYSQMDSQMNSLGCCACGVDFAKRVWVHSRTQPPSTDGDARSGSRGVRG